LRRDSLPRLFKYLPHSTIEENLVKEDWTIGHSTRVSMNSSACWLVRRSSFLLIFGASLAHGGILTLNREALITIASKLKHSVSTPSRTFVVEERQTPIQRTLPGVKLPFEATPTIWKTDAFKDAIIKLEKLALEKRTAYMCSEAVWWRCIGRWFPII